MLYILNVLIVLWLSIFLKDKILSLPQIPTWVQYSWKMTSTEEERKVHAVYGMICTLPDTGLGFSLLMNVQYNSNFIQQ